jgi:hypothetical protein
VNQPSYSERARNPSPRFEFRCDRCHKKETECKHLYTVQTDPSCEHILCEVCFPGVGSQCRVCSGVIINYIDLHTGTSFWDQIDRLEIPEEPSFEEDKVETPVDRICAVCRDDCTDPRMTPCAHRFCHICITTWLRDGGGRPLNRYRERPCPICRTLIAYDELIIVN